MTPLDLDLGSVQGGYTSLPLWIYLPGQLTVTVSAGPIPDALTSVVVSVQRAMNGMWVNVGGVSSSGSGSSASGSSVFQTRIGEQYRLNVLVTGSPIPVSARGY